MADVEQQETVLRLARRAVYRHSDRTNARTASARSSRIVSPPGDGRKLSTSLHGAATSGYRFPPGQVSMGMTTTIPLSLMATSPFLWAAKTSAADFKTRAEAGFFQVTSVTVRREV